MKKYEEAIKLYKNYGIDVDEAIKTLKNTKISIHCWQGDDIKGFYSDDELSGGISVTGNYPYKARNIDELRKDLSKVLELIPGKHKINLHAIYLDSKEKVSLDEISPKHFESWVKWAKEKEVGLDFNPTLFSHPFSEEGFTLSSANDEIRNFWIRHCKQSREIAAYFGKELNNQSICNIWIPDGYKDVPYDTLSPRLRLKDSLDQIFEKDYDNKYLLDTLESKLFGLGTEAYQTGTHEFYLSYAIKNNKSICLDTGHFHPTEEVGSKIASIAPFMDKMLLHVSRPMRWDSDHVVSLNDELENVTNNIIRNNLLENVAIGLDFFDASINRVAAWVIGIRNVQKSLLKSLLEPKDLIKNIELEGDYTKRLMLTEELKSLPFGLIYDYFCEQEGVLTSNKWYESIKLYEQEIGDRLNEKK